MEREKGDLRGIRRKKDGMLDESERMSNKMKR